MKAYRVISWILCIILTLIYIFFAYTVSSMFDIFPWYDGEGFYMLSLMLVWLPLCVVTLLQIVASVLAKRFDKAVSILLCLNAIYIPLIFVLGFADVPLAVFKTIGVIAVITMIAYVTVFIMKNKKYYNRNGE